MSLLKKIFKGVVGHYSYDENYLTRMLDDEKKNQHLKRLIDISDKLIEENPDFVDEVQKSETGCWMDQMFGTHECTICDFLDDCPIKLDADWQAHLNSLSEAERDALLAQYPTLQAPSQSGG